MRTDRNSKTITVVGAGLAGSECAWQLAERGHKVVLIEQRQKCHLPLSGGGAGQPDISTHPQPTPINPDAPDIQNNTPAHRTDKFAELVCSNSFGSQTDYSAPGQLKWEAERLGSLILKAAKESAVPAGMALGVDREVFSNAVTTAIRNHPNIEVRNEVVKDLAHIPRPAVIATGPLTDPDLAKSIYDHMRDEQDAVFSDDQINAAGKNAFLYFFDAIAPIVDADTINMDICFKADRFGAGNGDYINCPMEKEQYFAFIDAIEKARTVEPKEFEKNTPYFDGCMPIEEIVRRGRMTPRFGPMSSKGLENPRAKEGDKFKRPFAVVQLRQENKEGTAYNLVGFQTKMAYPEQQRIFKMIPGLENAEFLKLGSIHRNMYLHTPKKLTPFLASRKDPELFFAGQITGVEGYFDSTCIGLLVGRLLDDQLSGREMNPPPRDTAFGSLLNAITEMKEQFQPTNINFGLFRSVVDPDACTDDATQNIKSKEGRSEKKRLQLERAKAAFEEWIAKPQA